MVVPDVVIRRLPLYLRCLTRMERRGIVLVSSAELSQWTGFSPAQIRRDLSHFGEFGTQGLGYEVAYLRTQLRAILNADRDWHIALLGAGALGHALVHYESFRASQLHIVAVFDTDRTKIGQELGNVIVQPLDELASTIIARHIEIAILAVPAESAQEVADLLVAARVRSILNYAPITLAVPPDVHVAYIDPVASLQGITYYLAD